MEKQRKVIAKIIFLFVNKFKYKIKIMNPIFFHMNNFKKNNETKMTKTLETNITSEKSKSNSQTQVAQTTQNNNLSRKNISLFIYIF